MLAILRAKILHFSGKATFKYIVILTFFAFVSRGLGLVRQMLLYNLPSIDSDLIINSTKIPEFLVSLLIMGTISSSVLPVAARVDADKEDYTVSEYLNIVYLSIMGVLVVSSVLVLLFTPTFLEWTTSGEIWELFKSSDVLDRYINMTRILMLGPLAFATQGVFGIYLTLKERFTVYSWAGAIYNIGMIVGILLFTFNSTYQYAPAIGMMIGAIATSLLFVYEAKKVGYLGLNRNIMKHTIQHWKRLKPGLIDTWRVFLPRIFLLNGLVVGNLLISKIAQTGGQITAVDTALSIQGVFFSLIVSTSTVFYPNIAKTYHSDRKSKKDFWKRLVKFLEGVGLISLIGTVCTIFGVGLVIWIFGLFGKEQSSGEYIILITRISAIAIVFQSLVEILSKYIYIKERIWQPACISIAGLGLQLLVTLWLRYTVHVDAGIAVSVGIVINFIAVFLYMFIVAMNDRNRDLYGRQAKVNLEK
jgi:peptidoglycan biosynthesis protein MviN/MurJ (putative lipid II flippase)